MGSSSYDWDSFSGSSPWASDPSPPLASTLTSIPSPSVARLAAPTASAADEWEAGSDDGAEVLGTRSVATAAEVEADEDGEDTFDDASDGFGEPAAEDDDFGDFGDFDDGAGFAAEAPLEPEQSSATYFAIRPGMTNDEIAPVLAALFDRIFPLARQALSDEAERQVGGNAQTLVNEQTRHLFAQLCQPPAIRPVDWKRSRTRREHLIALGVPVNLDELAAPDARLLPPLVTSIPRRASPASAPVNGSASSRPSSRQNVVPLARPVARTPPPPPIDRVRATELLALTEEQLTLLPLVRLEAMKTELHGLASDASAGLTRALEKREALSTSGEAYDAKIQELVMAAQRLKPGPANNDLKRSGSNKNSMWRPNRAASPASGGSGRK